MNQLWWSGSDSRPGSGPRFPRSLQYQRFHPTFASFPSWIRGFDYPHPLYSNDRGSCVLSWRSWEHGMASLLRHV